MTQGHSSCSIFTKNYLNTHTPGQNFKQVNQGFKLFFIKNLLTFEE